MRWRCCVATRTPWVPTSATWPPGSCAGRSTSRALKWRETDVIVPTTSGQAFAAANAAMVRGVDGASTVHVLLSDCLELLGAETAGVLVRVGEQGLEMLAATSHRAAELELYQSQIHSGPCVEVIDVGHSV